jgi:hypothetical protein
MPKRQSHTSKRLCPKHKKVILRDRIEAELLLEHIQKNSRREIHDEKRTHACEFGFGWHLTSEDKRPNAVEIRHSA